MLKTDATPRIARGPVGLRVGAPLIPDDHGAYDMLLLPMVWGFIVGAIQGQGTQGVVAACLLFGVALVALFFASEPLGVVFKPRSGAAARYRAVWWLAIYLGVGVIAGAPLLLVWGLWELGWFAVVAAGLMVVFLVAVKMRKQRSLGVRMPGIICLTLSGPGAYYVVTGRLDPMAWGLWVACAIYFVGTVFNVRSWFEMNRQKKSGVGEPRLPGWLVGSIVGYLVVGGLAVAVLAAWGALPWVAYVAVVPSLLRAGWTLWRTPYWLPIKKVGLIEFAQSFAFGVLLVATIV
jgi:hypothetical protein